MPNNYRSAYYINIGKIDRHKFICSQTGIEQTKQDSPISKAKWGILTSVQHSLNIKEVYRFLGGIVDFWRFNLMDRADIFSVGLLLPPVRERFKHTLGNVTTAGIAPLRQVEQVAAEDIRRQIRQGIYTLPSAPIDKVAQFLRVDTDRPGRQALCLAVEEKTVGDAADRTASNLIKRLVYQFGGHGKSPFHTPIYGMICRYLPSQPRI